MPIPNSRADLVGQMSDAFSRLRADLIRAGPSIGSLACVDDWTVKDILWAGKWPISRWVSINTTRQYVTARTYIRRAIRISGGGDLPGVGS